MYYTLGPVSAPRNCPNTENGVDGRGDPWIRRRMNFVRFVQKDELHVKSTRICLYLGTFSALIPPCCPESTVENADMVSSTVLFPRTIDRESLISRRRLTLY